MADPLLLAGALLLAIAGMASLALSMEAHWEQIGRTGPPPRLLLRTLGWLGLLLSLACCLAADHVSMAALVWPMTIAAAAALVALCLSRLPERPRKPSPPPPRT